jgi:hypothetical protein
MAIGRDGTPHLLDVLRTVGHDTLIARAYDEHRHQQGQEYEQFVVSPEF